jgi:hypothetical protein
MPAGRPSKYTPELLIKAQEYCEKWQETGRVIPSLAGMAEYCGISRQLAFEWCKDEEKSEFLDVYTRVQQMQELELIDKGLTRQHDSSLSKMLLSKHGYSDKQEIDHTTKGEAITGITRKVID